MKPSSNSPELQRFLEEAVAPLESVLSSEGFQLTAAEHLGLDPKTGMPICFAVFGSARQRIQISHTDGEVCVHMGGLEAPSRLAQSPEWSNIRSLVRRPELSVEELLKAVPSSPPTIVRQSAQWACFLQEHLPSLTRVAQSPDA